MFFNILTPSALTPNKLRTAGSLREIDGFHFFQGSADSNLGQLGGKRECYLCAMPSPKSSHCKIAKSSNCLIVKLPNTF